MGCGSGGFFRHSDQKNTKTDNKHPVIGLLLVLPLLWVLLAIGLFWFHLTF